MNTLTRHALRNGVLTAAYVFGLAWFMSHLETWIAPPDTFVTVAAALLLFVVSALITSSLVLWEPVRLFMDGKRHEAARQLLGTGIVLVGVLIAAFVASALG